jgi:hypothetical protein
MKMVVFWDVALYSLVDIRRTLQRGLLPPYQGETFYVFLKVAENVVANNWQL